MISLTPRFSRFNTHVCAVGIVCLATILTSMIFVAARRNEGDLPVVHSGPKIEAPDASTKAKIARRFRRVTAQL